LGYFNYGPGITARPPFGQKIVPIFWPAGNPLGFSGKVFFREKRLFLLQWKSGYIFFNLRKQKADTSVHFF
jgi:hypothetical protein